MPLDINQQALFDKYKDHAFFKDDLGTLENIVTLPTIAIRLDDIMDNHHVKTFLAQSNFIKPLDILIYISKLKELCELFLHDNVRSTIGVHITREIMDNPIQVFGIARRLADGKKLSVSQIPESYESASFAQVAMESLEGKAATSARSPDCSGPP